MFHNYYYGMTDKRTYKKTLTPTIDEMDEETIRIIFSVKEEEMACLYFERPKKGWTNKPIMPRVWRCVESRIANEWIYIQGLVEPKELVAWGQELIKEAGK